MILAGWLFVRALGWLCIADVDHEVVSWLVLAAGGSSSRHAHGLLVLTLQAPQQSPYCAGLFCERTVVSGVERERSSPE